MPARPQGVVEGRNDPLLQPRLEVDHQVAAGDQVKARERRVADEVVHREQARLTQLLGHAVAAVLLDEVALQALGGQVRDGRAEVKPGPRGLDGAVVHVGREDLHRPKDAGPGQALPEQDRHRVGLLARGAPGNPDPERVGAARVRQQPRQDLRFERRKGFRVAEEPRDADQELAEQQLRLVRQRAQLLDVGGHLVGPEHVHPALDAAHQRAGLVLAEVAAEPTVQHRADRHQMARQVHADAVGAFGPVAHLPVALVVQQGGGHVLDREHVVHEAAGRGALRHAALGVVVELGLAEGQAAGLLDFRDAQGAVAAEPGQDDADRVLALVLRQRGEEGVDRGAPGGGRRRAGNPEAAAADRQDGVRRDDVDLVRAEDRAVLGEAHRHARVAADDGGQGAFVLGIKVLDQHEGHAGVGRHGREERLVGVQAAGRGADAHHQAAPGLWRGGRGRAVPRTKGGFARGAAGLAGLSCHDMPWGKQGLLRTARAHPAAVGSQ